MRRDFPGSPVVKTALSRSDEIRRLQADMAGDKTALSKQGAHAGLIPGRGTNIPHAVSHGQKIRVGKKRKEREGSAQ